MLPPLLRALQVGLFLAILIAGPLNSRFALVADGKVDGATSELKVPKLTWSSATSGEYVAGVDAYFDAHFGLRGYLILADNTLTYALFHQTPKQSRVYAGVGEALFIDDDIDFYNDARPVPDAKIVEQAFKLGKIARKLEERGRAIVFVLTPSKTSLNEADIAPELRRNAPAKRPSEVRLYSALIRELRAQRVPLVDGRALLRQEQTERGVPMFAPKARHYTQLAACIVLDALTETATEVLKRNVGRPTCAAPYLADYTSAGPDSDLYRLMNVWPLVGHFTEWDLPSQVEPRISPEFRPSVLIEGTSFASCLADHIRRNSLFGAVDLYYYNNTHFQLYADWKKSPIVPLSAEWKRDTLDRDLYVVELPETFLDWFSGGFVDQLYDAFVADRSSESLARP